MRCSGEIVVYSVAIRKRKDGFTKMKNKLTALLAALLLSISLLHTEVYASEISEKLPLETDVAMKESYPLEDIAFRTGALIHPTDPDISDWWN